MKAPNAMQLHTKERLQRGFTAIELLITLFVAAFAIAAGYQLYAAVISANGNTRLQNAVSNIAHDELQKFKTQATRPCSVINIPALTPTEVPDVGKIKIYKTMSCPDSSLPNLSKAEVVILYDTPERRVTQASYINPGEL